MGTVTGARETLRFDDSNDEIQPLNKSVAIGLNMTQTLRRKRPLIVIEINGETQNIMKEFGVCCYFLIQLLPLA